MSDKDYLEGRIEHWEETIADLKNRRRSVSERARTEYERQLDLMTSKLEMLKRKLAESPHENGEGSTAIGTMSEKILKEIEDAFSSATSKLE